MSELFNILAIIFLQYSFQVARTVGTLYNVKGSMRESLFFTFILQILWLFSTYLGIAAIMHSDWLAVFMYMVAGLGGSYHGIKIVQRVKRR